jgi:hypothetical protein
MTNLTENFMEPFDYITVVMALFFQIILHLRHNFTQPRRLRIKRREQSTVQLNLEIK